MNILQRLATIRDLPTLPEVMIKVQELITSDEGNAQYLAKIIEHDPSLTAKILRVANSSFFSGTGRRITSVQIAITRIGFNEVGNIAMAVSLIKKFSRQSNILDYKQFWRHSLVAGHITSLTMKDAGNDLDTYKDRSTYFLSGLLHDIGILIYDQFFHSEFEAILDYAMKKEISFLDAEQAVAPRETHSVLGSALLELWKLDLPVISAIRYHHNPEKSPITHRNISYSTHLSEYLLCNSGLGSFEGLIAQGDKNALNSLQLSDHELAGFLEDAENEAERSEMILALDTTEAMQLRAV